ncbi:hypothetical protein [Marinibacterium sp. SX1]|uniref:hypothetical protein n=1 Tax=Marinibacterium sp. SX1 TaxID=3388424 RepID=UPI003D1825DF
MRFLSRQILAPIVGLGTVLSPDRPLRRALSAPGPMPPVTGRPARAHVRLLASGLALTMALSAPTIAHAQDSLPRFDCPALLNGTATGDAAEKKRQGLIGAPLRLSWEGRPAPARKAPVVLVPLRMPSNGVTPLIARSEPVVTEDGVMSCTLVGMAFRPQLEASAPYVLEDLRGGPRAAELPLLLVARHDSVAEANAAFSQWVERGFEVPVQFPEPIERRRDAGEGGGTIYQTFGDHTVFRPLPLLGGASTTEASVLALNPDRAPLDAQTFLRMAGLDDARVILALCGSGDCADFRQGAQPAGQVTEAPLAPEPGPALPEDMPMAAKSATEDTGANAPGNPALTSTPDAAQAPDTAATAPEPDSAPVTSPRPGDRTAPPDGSGSPAAPLRLTYLGTDGREEALPDALARRLDCVLAALGADVFTRAPDCAGPAFAALRERRALIRPVDDGHWQIVAGARDRPPRAVIVTLPAGQTGAACRMDLVYDGPDGAEQRLPLDPVPGADPAQFTAVPQVPVPVVAGQARLRLEVSSAAACGAPGREIAMPTEAVLSVPLSDDRAVNRAVLNVVAMDAGDLDVALGLDGPARQQLGAQLIGAVEAAQARLAAQWGDRGWSLSSVGLARLDETEGLVPILALPADALRGGAATRFATIPPAARSALAEMRPRVTPETLAAALAPALRDAADRGVGALSVNLIAPVTPRTAVALGDPCADPRLASLSRDLADIAGPDGPEVALAVYPLVRLRPGDAPDLAGLQPLAFDPDAPSRPAGLTRCAGSDAALTIYPFFIEPWRPDGDIAGRYAAALADRLALHTAAQLTEDKAR